MAPTIAQTITVVNKSGKIMTTSKHIVNVFKEAQLAYRERKAELKAARKDEVKRSATSSKNASDSETPREKTRTNDQKTPVDNSIPRKPYVSGGHTHRQSPNPRNSNLGRSYTDSYYTNDMARPRRSPTLPSYYTDAGKSEAAGRELVVRRRRSHDDALAYTSKRRASQDADIDMDLAYGDLPPPLPTPASKLAEQDELKTKMTALEVMLEEANCLQHSATAIIKNLEANPDAMAAVALTLAEISNLAAKMAPGALAALGKATPAVMALLLSPEFLIAVGVGVGITVVMLGGYKIVKKIKAAKEAKEGDPTKEKKPKKSKDSKKRRERSVAKDSGVAETTDDVDDADADDAELEEIPVDLSHIEKWRRGVSEADTESIATSVDGEFLTPGAARSLRKEGKLGATKKEKKDKDKEKDKSKSKDKEAKEKAAKKEKDAKKSRTTKIDKADKAEKKAKVSFTDGMRLLSRKEKAAPSVDFI